MKLELKKFDPRTLKDDSVVVLIGKRRTGKSELMKHLLSYHQSLPIALVKSATERSNKFFEKFIPKMLIYDEFDPEVLNRFCDRQMKVTEQYNTEIAKYGRSSIDPRALLVLDDCLYDKSWPNDKNIRALFMNGRHFKVFFFITMQYPLGIPPHLRCNIDYIFILRENQIKNRMRIYEQYAGMFPTFEIFNQVMNQCTENYECLVIDNKTQSNKLEDQVYWYKGRLDDKFRLCSKELWDMQAMDEERRALGMAHEPDDEEDFDPAVTKKKNVPRIRVQKTYA